MNENTLFDLIGQVDDSFLEEVESSASKRKVWKRLVIAASLLLLVGLSSMFLPIGGRKPTDTMALKNTYKVDKDLQKISLSGFTGDGMGFSGLLVSHTDDLKTNNPWKESWDLRVLPIYKNKYSFYENSYIFYNYSLVQMKKDLKSLGKEIGFSIEDKDILVTSYEEHEIQEYKKNNNKQVNFENLAQEISYMQEDCELSISNLGDARLSFNDHSSLYVSKALGLEEISKSQEKMKKLGNYLQKNYSHFINLENPKMDIWSDGVDINGEKHYHMFFYQGSENPLIDFMNYQLGPKVEFVLNESDNIAFINYTFDQRQVKVGNYPLISLEEAKKKMLDKDYITNVPYDFQGLSSIGHVELQYGNTPYERDLIPYYVFYALVPEEEEELGLKTYGMYFVPAIEEEYLDKTTIYQGQFN